MSRTRRQRLALALVVGVFPLAELYLLLRVGREVGIGITLLLLAAGVVAGLLVVRSQGARAWRALSEAARTGRMPTTELADAALVLLAGLLLVLPGFLGDALALLLALPLTRPWCRRVLAATLTRHVGLDAGAGWGPGPGTTNPGPGPSGPVVRGEVVDDD